MGTVRILCAPGMQRVARKSRHRVADACDKVCAVLALNPEYGVVVRGHSHLRKMRVKAPGLMTGKSGGYRLIYARAIVDECLYLALVALYFKGDQEDLSRTSTSSSKPRADEFSETSSGTSGRP